MPVAVKVMLFQNTAKHIMSSESDVVSQRLKGGAGGDRVLETRQLVLREAAVCCSVCHPNVVATYRYEVLQASTFHDTSSGLMIDDISGERSFKLYLIQVLQG